MGGGHKPPWPKLPPGAEALLKKAEEEDIAQAARSTEWSSWGFELTGEGKTQLS